MKKVCLILTLCLLPISTTLFAQLNPKIYGNSAEFKKMAKKPLIVELLEEDPKIIAKLSKKPKTAQRLKDYKAFIVSYNEMIQKTVPKYWKMHETIEYRSASEVKKLRDAKDANYVLLFYTELKESTLKGLERSGLAVPALVYTRPNGNSTMFDYKIYLPSSYIREDRQYLECDFKFALIAAQANINWIIKTNKALNFEDFCKASAQSKCSKLGKLDLMVEKDFLYKNVSEDDARAAYGKKIEFVTAEEINEAVLNETSGKAVLFSMPFGTISGSIGPVSSSALAFIKVIVNVETWDIMYIHIPGVGKSYVYQMLKNEFERIPACKM